MLVLLLAPPCLFSTLITRVLYATVQMMSKVDRSLPSFWADKKLARSRGQSEEEQQALVAWWAPRPQKWPGPPPLLYTMQVGMALGALEQKWICLITGFSLWLHSWGGTEIQTAVELPCRSAQTAV